jgi:hypothetical protein
MAGAFADRQQLGGHFLHWQNEIDQAGIDSAARHAVVLGLGRILGDRESAVLLDSPESDYAVGADAGQQYRDRVLAVCIGQGAEEQIDRGGTSA